MINFNNLEIESEAANEIIEIFEWYEREKNGLGNNFYSELEDTLKKILQNPLAFSKIKRHGKIRRTILHRFPYKIFYDPSAAPIKIIAIIHSSRSSKHISKRIK